MSKVSSLVLGVVSGAAMFGAIQYASGNDLHGTSDLRGTLTDQDKVAFNTVNRAAKSDRAPSNISQADQQSQTLSFHVHGVSDTSILVRLAGSVTPVKTETSDNNRAVSITAKPQRAAVACEPPVSMLTEVAKLLQPGRCVT